MNDIIRHETFHSFSNFFLSKKTASEVPFVSNRFVKAFTKCQVRSFRERSSDCPAWRAVALANIALDMNDGILGMQMPFTILEWKEMMDVSQANIWCFVICSFGGMFDAEFCKMSLEPEKQMPRRLTFNFSHMNQKQISF